MKKITPSVPVTLAFTVVFMSTCALVLLVGSSIGGRNLPMRTHATVSDGQNLVVRAGVDEAYTTETYTMAKHLRNRDRSGTIRDHAHSHKRWLEPLERRALLSSSLMGVLEIMSTRSESSADSLMELAAGRGGADRPAQAPFARLGSPFSPGADPTMPLTGRVDGGSESNLGGGDLNVGGDSNGSRPRSDFRFTLRPGSGFSGATPIPPARGTGLGASSKVIADWDVVPYQAFSDTFNVGVVAWHINAAGMDNVSFSVNGGAWTPITTMQMNPDSGVREYYATLKASMFSAGPVELRAIAYPVVGQPVVLAPLKLYADPANSFANRTRFVTTTGNDTTGDGSQGNPFRTVARAATSIQQAFGSADGGTIFLGAGSYDATHNVTTTNAVMTIRPMAGLGRGAVTINDWNGQYTRRMHVQGLTLRTGLPVRPTNDLGTAWIDDSDLIGEGRLEGLKWVTPQWNGVNWVTGAYMTDVTITNSLDGQRNAALIRNAVIYGIGSNFITGTWTSINVDCYDVDPGSSGAHPDVYHGYGALPDTIILYGVTAGVTNNDGLGASRGINAFDGSGSDLAIVNTTVNCSAGWGTSLELGNCDNVLIKDSTFISNVQLHAELPHSNTVFENVSLPTGSNPSPQNVPGITVR